MASLKQLRHLTAIAEQGNMHKAAEVLHITQPALTRSLSTLERLLNVRLFDRHSGGMRPTIFCLEIIEKCQQVLLDVEDIQRAARIYQNIEAGELHIGVGRGVRELVLRTSLPEFVFQHPNISITVGEGTHEELDERLKQRNVDLLITGLGSHWEVNEYRRELITNVSLSVLTRKGHPLQSQKNISFSQLAKYPLITSTLVGPTHRLRDTVQNATGLSKPHIACSDFPTLIAVLLCSDSWLISSEYNCAPELQQGTLVKLDATHPSLNTELGIIEMNKRSRSPAAQKFIDILTNKLTS
ncbi:LysR family transcriptional regulator [Candidatus Seongchinamella marina]|nr:LysR family transcriptional regulator [Candidatus Seongchinamella marina]